MTVQTASSTIAEAFDGFDENLKLDAAEREQAIERWKEVRDSLSENSLCTSSFLQGSFGRKTMRKPLKDVDVVVFVSESLVARARQDVGTRGSNTAEVVMRYFEDALRATFPGATFEVGAKALTVGFDDVPFTVDLTPALESEERWVRIGNTETGEWERSDTRIIGDRVSTRNQACGGRFVRQVRMARELVAKLRERDPRLEFVKGLTAESLVYMAVKQEVEHADAMLAFLRTAKAAVLGPIYTPSGVDDLTQKHEWTDEHRQLARTAFGTLLDDAEEALVLDQAGDPTAAQWAWAEILGAEFPQPATSELDALRRAQAGSVTRTGITTAAVTTPVKVAPQRAWAP